VLRGRDVQDFEELKRQGLSIRAISRLTGYCRKTVRKYLIQSDTVPVYGPRSKQPGRLEPFKPYLEERMRAGVWNARVLLRELREHGYSGGYTLPMNLSPTTGEPILVMRQACARLGPVDSPVAWLAV
jgi:transposase